MKIYKMGPGKKDLTETLSYKLVTEHKDDKWGFIEEYWTRNYNRYN